MPLGLGVIAEICGNTCCQSQWECHGMHLFPLWSSFPSHPTAVNTNKNTWKKSLHLFPQHSTGPD